MKLTRCFVAIQLSPAAVAEIKRIQDILMDRFHFDGKLTESEQLHLTLKFLGEIDDDTLETVRRKLAEITFDSFIINLGGVGVFSEKIPGILWIKLSEAEPLQKKVDDCLQDLFPPEKRFMGHVTIARIKDIRETKKFIDYLKSLHYSTG